MAITAYPTGLSIKRNGMQFIASWKKQAKNHDAGQGFQWYRDINAQYTEGPFPLPVEASATELTVTLRASDYYPYVTEKRLTRFFFWIRGRQGPDSGGYYDWSYFNATDMILLTPRAPKLSAEPDRTNNNITVFEWDADVSNSDNAPFTDIEWQSILVAACNVTDGSKLSWDTEAGGWQTGTSAEENDSVNITEDTTVIQEGSHTRWFRARSRGPAGPSAWVYTKRVFAIPNKAVITDTSAEVSGTTTRITVGWSVKADAMNPIETATVQYLIAEPAAGQETPVGASWRDGSSTAYTSESDKIICAIDDAPAEDQCLWVRVVTIHGTDTTYSDSKLVHSGPLADPSGVTVSTNDSTYRATITATNESAVPDSFLEVVYRRSSQPSRDYVCGVIPHGSTSVTVQCPDWSQESAIAFGVRAVQGSYEAKTRADGVTQYAVMANMASKYVWNGGSVPQAPSDITAVRSEVTGEVIVTWDWPWEEADTAELSWATNPNAWESTDGPETYLINSIYAAKWRVSNLETGQRWYFRVRLGKTEDEKITFGPYSDMVTVLLSDAPDIPMLNLTAGVIAKGGALSASWGYISNDGTPQAYAELCMASVNGSTVTHGEVIAHTETDQHVAVDTSEWEVGSTYFLCVRVVSGSEQWSEWSDPVAVAVALPVTCNVTTNDLPTTSIDGRNVRVLSAIPLTLTVTGAGAGGQTVVAIERAEEYHMIRPDEKIQDGFHGETIVSYSQTGEAAITITENMVIGALDDGASYNLIATVQDGNGQSASVQIPFEVHWTHQAEEPTVICIIEDGIAKITATAPESYVAGDVCDIYRLSADKPQQIIKGGAFGVTYVDPYPNIGDYGYRVVDRTLNGDYITADSRPAWTDVKGGIDEYSIIVDFDGQQVVLPYDIDLSNGWAKDFQVTNYLGGAQKGDWNPAVTRTGTYSVVLFAGEDDETIEGLRRLADYPGICHIRTPEGSGFACDIQVSEQKTHDIWEQVMFTLAVTRVDSEDLDGIELEEQEP